MPYEEPSSAPLMSRLQATLEVITRGFEHRAELIEVELAEARAEATSILSTLLVSGVAVLLAGVAVNILVAAVWWDTPYRVRSLAILTGVEVAIAITAVVRWRTRLSGWQPLATTAQQFKKDSQCLRESLAPTQPQKF